MPIRRVARQKTDEIEILLQEPIEILRAEAGKMRDRELDGERNAVETPNDVSDRIHIGLGERIFARHVSRASNEQFESAISAGAREIEMLVRAGQTERREPNDPLVANTQSLARGREDRRRETHASDVTNEAPDPVDDMLAAIENEQRCVPRQGGQRRLSEVLRARADAELARERRPNIFVFRSVRQVEPDRIRTPLRKERARGAFCDGGLADAARPSDGEGDIRPERIDGFAYRVVPTDDRARFEALSAFRALPWTLDRAFDKPRL
ncbi:hypothetical protein [Methylosinus sp. C49]|uniref:hypothetical protein n=1 Tax=Methylosinus sp. C49 TaxID=2699395 RepID=UPI001FCEB9C5|nr:hypothetical protein [Methylosinus sp. C49]